MVTKANSSQLSERSLYLFKVLVEHFIQDGAPVGSRTLAKDSSLNLSPATIRNVMADLEDFGLLDSPHTSSGRVPTAKGYRLFVDSLLRVKDLNSIEVEKIAKELDPENDFKSLMQRTSSMLSDITQLAGVVMLPRTEQSTLQHMEFVALSGNRVLVILVVNDREVQNRIIHTSRAYSASELQEASNYLNEIFVGKDLTFVRNNILDELERTKEKLNQSMQTAIEMAQLAFDYEKSKINKDELFFSGETNLMDVAELCEVEKLKKLFNTFNQKRDILHLLEQAISADGIQIFIGEESGHDVLDNCSVVTSPYEVDGKILGVLGVIGPTRMHYERVIPIVDVTAKMLGSALNPNN
ncbi:MAG TPA: heat-inducible transcriptional repressor HrcA [Gammaproteobacteria bacterium]|jgi:heat-inducible transcriptional repressor|nr:heat-inducible transcriptional repressor HrcA [Gammaproteobacteria bacterium]|tara:strand:+ start:882 stop:1943 length:1062 start_codon:yes stop_codon:yes gene_type:complete